jgi:hypothetical protein
LSQLQEEENRPYCKFYCFFNGNAIWFLVLWD